MKKRAIKKRQGDSRPPLERMMYISRLLQRGERFTMATVASHFEISRKAVQHDLDFMRDRLGYQIKWLAKGLELTKRTYVGQPPKERVL